MHAKIKIEYLNDSEWIQNGKDQILLFCKMNGYPFDFSGVIYLMIEAYDNLKDSGKTNSFFPENFASELMRVSFDEEYGFCRITPATRLMYQQYDKGDYLTYVECEYVCDFKWDDDAKFEMELAVAGFGDEISKSMIEWKAVSEIARLIAYADSPPYILMDETIPCNDCIIRATCVQSHRNRLFAHKPCGRLREYKENEIKRLREELPEWSIPLVF